jgi:hypothetical protein
VTTVVDKVWRIKYNFLLYFSYIFQLLFSFLYPLFILSISFLSLPSCQLFHVLFLPFGPSGYVLSFISSSNSFKFSFTDTCYTIQLMHYSHFKTHSLQHLKPIKC